MPVFTHWAVLYRNFGPNRQTYERRRRILFYRAYPTIWGAMAPRHNPLEDEEKFANEWYLGYWMHP